MAEQSLEDLKKENAELAKAEEPKPDTTVEDDGVIDEGEEVEADKATEQEPESGEDADKGESEVESWMKTDSEGGFKPDSGAAAVRRKLKGKIAEKDSELEKLRAEVETLKGGASQSPESQPAKPTPRPKFDDFNDDEAAYDTALDEWHDNRMDAKIAAKTQASTNTATVNAVNAKIKVSVDAHYGRANKLVDDGKVTEESYMAADSAVRRVVEGVFKGNGDTITDSLISKLNDIGDGSEKVIYSLGVNPARLEKFKLALSEDPYGLKAAMYLGSLQAAIATPQKKRSSTAKPGAKADGEGGSGGPSGTLAKRYKSAGDNVQARISIKREAKRANIDTSQW